MREALESRLRIAKTYFELAEGINEKSAMLTSSAEIRLLEEILSGDILIKLKEDN